MPALYQNNQDIPEEMLLGNLLFYNLTDMEISESDLLGLFVKNNLSQNYVRKISHADAFRRATSSIKNENVLYTDDTGACYDGKINVDEVTNDSFYIKRIVGVRVLNDKLEEVYYKQIGTITYDRDMDNCSYATNPNINNGFNQQDIANYNSLLDLAKMRYYQWSTYHNHDTIKNILNRIVNSMHPVALMPTGICKFIPKTSKDTLYGLNGLLSDLSSYASGLKENTVEIIPIIDTQEHRELVNKMFENEIKEDLYEYSQELANILKNKTSISPRQATSYLEKYKYLKEKTDDYQNLLGTYTENIKLQLKSAIQLINDNTDA